MGSGRSSGCRRRCGVSRRGLAVRTRKATFALGGIVEAIAAFDLGVIVFFLGIAKVANQRLSPGMDHQHALSLRTGFEAPRLECLMGRSIFSGNAPSSDVTGSREGTAVGCGVHRLVWCADPVD